MCADGEVLDLTSAAAVWESCGVVGMTPAGGLRVGREAWNDWLKSANLVSVGGSDIGVSFEKYSL